MNIYVWSLIFAFTCISGCTEQRRADELLTRASTSEFGDGAYRCSDTIKVAAKAGVDYKDVVDRTMRRDASALHTLFWLTADAGFDAASSEGHAAVLGNVLRYVGDDTFGTALNTESEPTRKTVLDALRYDFGVEANILTEELLAQWYPLTFARSAGR